MNDFESTIDGLAAVALGVYVAVIAIRGNLKSLLGELTKETGYLEFIVAIFLIYELTKIKAIRPITLPLAGGALIILAMRIVNGSDTQAFTDFRDGKIGLIQLAGKLFSTQA